MKTRERLPLVAELGATPDWPTKADKKRFEDALTIVLDTYNTLGVELQPTLLVSLISTVCLQSSDPEEMRDIIFGWIEEALKEFMAQRGRDG